MRKAVTAAAASLLTITSCVAGGTESPTVLVDYSYDEFASYFLLNFPRQIEVEQGTEIVFRQTWTGEPHTITGGTLVDDLMEVAAPYTEMVDAGEPLPGDIPPEVEEREEPLIYAFSDETDDLDQTAAQPCYLDSGEPRKDSEPCDDQVQPEFTGEQSYYNSGIIPYEGPQGNEYRVQLANDIDPGSYWFYCNVHGPLQSTEVVVRPQGEDVQSPAEIRRRARVEIQRQAAPLQDLWEQATTESRISATDPASGEEVSVEGNFAGIATPDTFLAAINEFVPGQMTVEAGEPITWNMLGVHSISFGVPRYFPIIEFLEDGTVRRNAALDPPAGGANPFEEPGEPSGEPVAFDGGTYDGEGFWSSGTIFAEPYIEYTMTISEPGTYRYACLIHPEMVGTVDVT